jgi:hypothetical protein
LFISSKFSELLRYTWQALLLDAISTLSLRQGSGWWYYLWWLRPAVAAPTAVGGSSRSRRQQQDAAAAHEPSNVVIASHSVLQASTTNAALHPVAVHGAGTMSASCNPWHPLGTAAAVTRRPQQLYHTCCCEHHYSIHDSLQWQLAQTWALML